MDAHRGLAQRVAALRHRLQELEPVAPADSSGPADARVQQLHQVCHQLSLLQGNNLQVQAALLDVTGPPETTASAPCLPRQLTWRTRRLLLQGRALLEELKALAGRMNPAEPDHDRLLNLYQQTLNIVEVALRAVQTFPEPAVEQLRLGEGLEGILGVAQTQAAGLRAILDRRRAERNRVEGLAHLLAALVQGRPILWKSLQDLAETVAAEAHPGAPLRFLPVDPGRPEVWAAAHGLNTAQVLARLARQDAEWRGRLADVTLAALVYDAGMAAMPPDILTLTGPPSEEQRRQIEAHAGLGAEALHRLAPGEAWLVDAARAHHERLDGTGYPVGLQGQQIPRLARLLAVGDVYVALASPRPHRAALSPRAALTETLLEAEKGRLDTGLAEYLLELTFYPVGTVVELSDGRLGMVVATNSLRGDVTTPARPVVQILPGEEGPAFPWPEHVNLAQAEGQHIVRSLTAQESRPLLGMRHWQLY
jgi:HD-GYP domain-containing protein (c-di-GMP phosphodiesterase class II)